MSFKYILDSVKEKFEVKEKYENEGFPDLYYEVGNTSSMDMAPNVPTAIDERIGSLAGRGGSVMEVIVENPSTFQIDRERMLNVINQLDIDISLHSDPNIGYTSGYRSQYDPTHNYFTMYLKQFASFKKDIEIRTQKDPEFEINVQRINPHISTTHLPDLEEERAGGTALDPFGYSIGDLSEDLMRERTSKHRNIYKNPEFLRRLYRVFFKDFFGDQEYQYYQNLTSFSPRFDKEWRRAQNKIADLYYENIEGVKGTTELEKKAQVAAVGGQDPAAKKQWLQILENEEKYKLENPVEIPQNLIQGPNQDILDFEKIKSLKDFDDFVRNVLDQRYSVSDLRMLSDLLYYLKNRDLNRIRSRPIRGRGLEIPGDGEDQFQGKLWREVEPKLREALDDLWTANEEDTDLEDDRKVSLIPVEAKVGGLTSQLEIPQGKIQEEAFTSYEDLLSEEIEDMFGGKKESFKDESREDIDWAERYDRFLKVFIGNFEQVMWRESNLMYQIVPAWLSVAEYDSEEEDNKEGHKGWKAPKFLWDVLVKQKWEAERGYDIDLLNPRSKDTDNPGFLDLLEQSREFQRDVAAASAAVYVWSHFTQKEEQFELSDQILRDSFNNDQESLSDNVKHNRVEMTWIEWMNKFGIGVNLEAMPKRQNREWKIWRPKDIAAAARAINITAREELGELHEDLYEMPAKFTIDLEHTATFGVDPWKTMEDLIKQEEDLLENGLAEEYNLEVEEGKPLAKILRMWHLMRAGVESSQGTLHGGWDPGDKQLYTWLWEMVKAGFARDEDGEKAYVMYEVGGDDRGTVYMARIAMNLIELGVSPEELDPSKVNPDADEDYRDEKEALMARFFGMDRPSYDREWAKIEQHAFDPLQGLLSAEQFDYTYSSNASMENNNQPQDWMEEEYR